MASLEGSAMTEPEEILENCSKCSVILRSLQDIKQHKLMHSEAGLFRCPRCPEVFQQVTKLLRHLDQRGHHGLACGVCHAKVETEAEMVAHLDNHRTKGRPFSCQFCGAKFRSNRELGLHIPKHTDNHPFICTVCQKGFKWKQVLKMHMITHSGDEACKHKCSSCNFRAKHKSTIITHQNRHLGRSFTCPQPGCTFSTAREQNLRAHKKKHKKETRVSCPSCPQQFSHQKNLLRHQAHHHNPSLPSLACPDPHCGFTSCRRDKMVAHARIHVVDVKEELAVAIHKVSSASPRTCAGGLSDAKPGDSEVEREVDDRVTDRQMVEAGPVTSIQDNLPFHESDEILLDDASSDEQWSSVKETKQTLVPLENIMSSSRNSDSGTRRGENELCIDTFRYISPPNVTVGPEQQCQHQGIHHHQPKLHQHQLHHLQPEDIAEVLREAGTVDGQEGNLVHWMEEEILVKGQGEGTGTGID